MQDMPRHRDPKFRHCLLQEIHACGGLAIAEDLRPLVAEVFGFTLRAGQDKDWTDRVSWALIDLRNEGLLESPFGELGSRGNREWIRAHRPGRDPSQQVWGLTSAGRTYMIKNGLAQPRVADRVAELEAASRGPSDPTIFDPVGIEDARERIATTIVARRGQDRFRKRLLTLYQRRCAITGTAVEEVLEAAHIIPYRGDKTNHPSNGLLLRADVHTLFDLGLVAVDTKRMTIIVSARLQPTEYRQYAGKLLALPTKREDWPSAEALDSHREQTFS